MKGNSLAAGLRMALACLAAAGPLAVDCAAAETAPAPAPDRRIAFAIPAQPLTSALIAFSEQAGVQVLMPSVSVDALRSAGVQGQLPLREALERVLAETGLSYRLLDAHTVTIFGAGGGQGDGSDPRQDADAADLGAVMVTATRRETSVADVPYNLQVITAANLDDMGAKSASDFVRAIPGMSFIDYGKLGGVDMAMRGLRAGHRPGTGMDRRTTSIYIDDIEIPSSLNPAIVDIERLEVLRGPQGTLYGSGAIGGTLRYITVAPSLEEVEGRISAEIGHTRHGGLNHELRAMLNVPIAVDAAAIRMNISRSDNSGFLHNVTLDEDGINWDRNLSGRLGFMARPAERLDIGFTYYMDRSDFGVSSTVADDVGPYSNAFFLSGRSYRDTDLAGLVVNYRFDGFTATSASSHRKYRSQGRNDITFGIRDEIFGSFLSADEMPELNVYSDDLWRQENWTQEVRLVSDGDSRLNWVAGAYWTDTKLAEMRGELVPIPFPGQAEFEENVVGARINDEHEYITDSDVRFRQVAAFGELGYRITPAWNVSLGGRWFRYEASSVFYAIDQYWGRNARDENGFARRVPYPSEFLYGSAESTGSIFRFNTSYDLGRNNLVYATIAEGFRPGGYNNASPNTGIEEKYQMYEPDSIVSYEMGAKGTGLGGKLFYSTAFYYVDWQDMQTTGYTDLGFNVTRNAGAATSRGLELETTIRDVLAPGMDVSFTYAYNDMHLSEPIVDLGRKGDRAPFVPQHTASVNLGYRFDVGSSMRGSLNLLTTYTGESFTAFGEMEPDADLELRPNPFYLKLDGYMLTGVTAQLSGYQWSVRLGVHNLFDKVADVMRRHYEITSPFRDPFQARVINRPRTVSLGFTYNF